jgi:Zn-dependent membrane protease YugP
MFFPILDWTMILLVPAILLTLYAQMKVKSTFNKYSSIAARSGLTGAQVARDLLRRNGVPVSVERTPGELTDHYDPRSQVLRLSGPVHDSHSLAALGVAAHEAGHAMQHEDGYFPWVFETVSYRWPTLAQPCLFPSCLLAFLWVHRCWLS